MELIDKSAVIAEIEKQGTIQPQLSWFTVIYLIVMALWELFQEHYGDIVIKGKKR